MKKFVVYDSVGAIIRAFNSLKDATTFKLINNRFDWAIREVEN